MVTKIHICDVCDKEFKGLFSGFKARAHERTPVVEGNYDGVILMNNKGPMEYSIFAKDDSYNENHERQYLVCRIPVYAVERPKEYSSLDKFRTDLKKWTPTEIESEIRNGNLCAVEFYKIAAIDVILREKGTLPEILKDKDFKKYK